MFERFLVFDGQPRAQFDEVRPRHRHWLLAWLRWRLKIRVVGQRRIAAHAVVVLDAALRGQAVVVPTHRIEHFLAAHPLKARDQVGMRVRKDVSDVQRAADGRRRRVDGINLSARTAPVKPVDTGLFPTRYPFRSRPESGFSGRDTEHRITTFQLPD